MSFCPFNFPIVYCIDVLKWKTIIKAEKFSMERHYSFKKIKTFTGVSWVLCALIMEEKVNIIIKLRYIVVDLDKCELLIKNKCTK